MLQYGIPSQSDATATVVPFAQLLFKNSFYYMYRVASLLFGKGADIDDLASYLPIYLVCMI